MRKILLCCAISMLVSVSLGAVDVPLRDGSVVQVESYKVIDGYVLIKFGDGGQVAYATADIDMQALRQAEMAAREADPQNEAGEKKPGRSSKSILGAVSEQQDSTSGVLITDQDVEHIRQPDVAAEGEETEEEGEEAEEEPVGAGAVVVQDVFMEPAEDGWIMRGEVFNGSKVGVQDIQVEIVSRVGDEVIDSSRIKVAAFLQPGKGRTFAHKVAGAEQRPQAIIRAFWMEPSTER
ncbi:MAG: hypothetical protein GY906_09765 [bacterium]|nr:hypothetical protein [bacterium]